MNSICSDDPRRAAVKLLVVTREANHFQPWELGFQEHTAGSACVLPNRLLLTNAHVVNNCIYVQAVKPGDPIKYHASVVHVDHDRELALLSVDDPAFFDDTSSVSLGELPKQDQAIAVYGFPLGGDDLAVSRGVVSRIEVHSYTHSKRLLLAIQTDAVIDGGSSGGPAFDQQGGFVGIAFQSSAKSARIGYIIPSIVIGGFLRDTADNQISGVPDLGISWQRIENHSLRKYLGLREGSGVLVTNVVFGSTAAGIVHVGDVIRSIAGHEVACDGSVMLNDIQRVNFSHVISCMQVGGTVALTAVRNQAPRDLELVLRPFTSLVPLPGASRSVSYFVFAGLVFVRLTRDYMKLWEWDKMPFRYKHLYYDGLLDATNRQVVIISQILADEVNVGYHKMFGMQVESINGIRISEISDVPRAFLSPKDGFHVILVDNQAPRTEIGTTSDFGTTIVLDAAMAEKRNATILSMHRISSDRSADL